MTDWEKKKEMEKTLKAKKKEKGGFMLVSRGFFPN